MQVALWEDKARAVVSKLRARSSIFEAAAELHHNDWSEHKIPIHDQNLAHLHDAARKASHFAHHEAEVGKNKHAAHVKAAELHTQAAHELGKAGYSKTAKLHHDWAHHHATRASQHAARAATVDNKKPRHPGQAHHTGSGEYHDVPQDANRARRVANAASRNTNHTDSKPGFSAAHRANMHRSAAQLHTHAAEKMHQHGFGHQAHKHVTRAMRHLLKATSHEVSSKTRHRPPEKDD